MSDENSIADRTVPRESGPRRWFREQLEGHYMRLEAVDDADGAIKSGDAAGVVLPAPGTLDSEPTDGAVLSAPRKSSWSDTLAEYHRRRVESAFPSEEGGLKGGRVPGGRNWEPLGPSLLRQGQAHGRPNMGGRVARLAIASGGRRLYAATANGGVFRSDDGGAQWRSMMDEFDLDPASYASTSLCCGAIAIDPRNPDRVYVGTGEGDTHSLFGSRVIGALPAYRGIGPIRSDDGGRSWVKEPTAAESPTLEGEAFFELAVDPAKPENALAATTVGLYQRVRGAGGAPHWVRRMAGLCSSVIAVVDGGATRFYAGMWRELDGQGNIVTQGGVFTSTTGEQWTEVGADTFPRWHQDRSLSGQEKVYKERKHQPGRIALAERGGWLYAMVAAQNGALHGIYVHQAGVGRWVRPTSQPAVLPLDDGGGSQGGYDLALAVDPNDPSIIYVGGSYFDDTAYEGHCWPASIWQCRLAQDTAGGKVFINVPIGMHAHADVHALVHSPGNSHELWACTDGGIFVCDAIQGLKFEPRNDGLACLCTNYFDQHPTSKGVLIAGLQDNGTAFTQGTPEWTSIAGGDGGYSLINWADPRKMMTFANGELTFWNPDGSYESHDFQWYTMTSTVACPPYNPASPKDADIVATAYFSYGEHYVMVTTSFGLPTATAKKPGEIWPLQIKVPISQPDGDRIYSIVFASARRMFLGTVGGEVYRIDIDAAMKQGVATRLDNAAGGPIGVRGWIGDIAVDWADKTLSSVYVVFAGCGDWRHAWHFDGKRWQARSGPAATSKQALLDVEHNAIAVDPQAPGNVYVGANIGVWHSADRGATWSLLTNGLPDAPVFDLRIHPTQRLLRASTHGRGMFEWALDPITS